jgi:CRISPR-associated protein Cmr3
MDALCRYYFVEPLDVLMLRGNRSFGSAGEHGEMLLPPWPSLFAGAFRSALLGSDASRLAEFVAIGGDDRFSDEDKRCRAMHSVLGPELFDALGTPQRPGRFRITWASMARQNAGRTTPLVMLPADLIAHGNAETRRLSTLKPTSWPAGLRGSTLLQMSAFLPTPRQVKPLAGLWLDGEGMARYLQGGEPAATLETSALLSREVRLGIAVEGSSRTASEGALYTSEAVALREGVGFLVGIAGAVMLPGRGMLRLGGDGRAARWQQVCVELPASPPLAAGGRFRLVLASPGLFSGGWLPEGVTRDSDHVYRLHGAGFRSRLACAAVPRHEVVSGWDLARWAPKVARRAASAGSVYWFDQLEGDAGKLADWVSGGLWPDNATLTPELVQRRAEGFNHALIGCWP